MSMLVLRQGAWSAAVFACCMGGLGALGCGGDSSPAATTYSADASAACPHIAGTFSIRAHCSAALVGTQVGVEQEGCDVVTTGAFPGFHGTLDQQGRLLLTGSANGMDVSCTGMASAVQITQSCTGDCEVTLAR